MSKLSTGIFGAVLATGMLVAQSVQAAPAKLTAASFLPLQISFGWPFKSFVDDVNQRCSGLVSIDVLPPGAIKAFEQPNALKTGVIDMMSGPPTYYQGSILEGDAFTIADMPVSEMRKTGAMDYMNDLHRKNLNAEMLTYFGDGVPFHIYLNKPAKNNRFDDLVIRTTPIYKTLLEELGATTVTTPPPEVATALERGTVDGYGWPIWGIAEFGWHKHTKYRVEPSFFKVVVAILMNQDKWKSLNGDQQGCLKAAVADFEANWPSMVDDYTAKELKIQNEAGIQPIDFGADFKERAKEIYWKALAAKEPESIAKLRKMLNEE